VDQEIMQLDLESNLALNISTISGWVNIVFTWEWDPGNWMFRPENPTPLELECPSWTCQVADADIANPGLFVTYLLNDKHLSHRRPNWMNALIPSSQRAPVLEGAVCVFSHQNSKLRKLMNQHEST